MLNFPSSPNLYDTFTTPSGISYIFNGVAWDFLPPGSLNLWKYKTENYTALNNDRIIADTSSGTFTLTLPSNPVNGTYVQITDGDNFLTNNLIVDPNGNTVEGYNDDVALDLAGITYEFIFSNGTWQLTATTGAQGPSGGVGNANTANLLFTTNTMYSNTGVMISNQGTATGATALLDLPGNAGPNINLQNNYGSITLVAGTNPGATKIWTFGSDGTLDSPGNIIPSTNLAYDLGSTSSQWRSLYVGTSTIYLGGTALSVIGGTITLDGTPVSGGGATSTLTAGTATLSINTLSETLLPSGLTFAPIENYGFGFGGTFASQTYGEQLQVLATGTGAFGLFGWGEVIGGPGGVAYVVGNQDGTNEVKIVAGSYTATVNTWKFGGDGTLTIPNAILGSGDQALVIQNTASGVAYLELPVDPSTDSVILANQAASSATVTIRVGDFGSEKNWTFDEFGALATPGIIYNTDTSNVGQLLLAGAPGEPATYLALPSDVGSTSMNVRLVNSNGNIQLTAGNNTWLYNDSGELTLPNGSMLFESSLIAASGTNAVLSQFDSNTQVYTMDYAVGVQTHNSGTYHTWLFNNTGDLELPGGSVLATSGYDVALIAGNDGTSTFGTVTISTQYPPDLTDRNWEFNSLGELNLPLGGAIQETVVTNEIWGTTTTSITLVPAGAANGTQRLEIYSTGAGEGDHIHITSGDQNQTDLFLGNDTQYFSVGAMGQMEVRARPGLASPSPGTGAYAGSPVWIYAGDAGDNGGNQADGALGGDILLQAGISSLGPVGLGGSVYLKSGNGISGYGSIKLSTDNGSTYLEFNKDNQLVFPSGSDIVFDSSATSNIYGVTGIEFADATTQTTAFTGTSALLDITNTNGIDTTYYLTFVENRSAGQEVRADVDLTWNSWSNTLGLGGVAFADGTTQTTAYGFVSPPVSSTSTGVAGALAKDATYFYVCTATNAWQRISWDNTPW